MTETHPGQLQRRTPDHISEADTITIENALLRWRISRNEIFKLMRAGRLESVKDGGRRLIVIRSMRQHLGLARKPA